MNNPRVLHILLLVFLLHCKGIFAISTPPVARKACLNTVTAEVTLYFDTPTDACNSFSFYELWGRDNAFSAFTRLATLSTYNSTQIQAILPNKKKWELYIAVMYACNGTDTLFSNHVWIDDQPPGYIEPDSVSVDPVTQHVIAGWQKSPDPDVMGYSIIKADPSTGKNVLIDSQKILFYDFPPSVFDSKIAGNKMAIAAFDSCKNGGLISNFHSPIVVNFNTGQNVNYICTKKLYVSWTPYVGWPVDTYDVYVWNSGTNSWALDGSVAGSTLTYIYNITTLGLNYSFKIRAHKQASAITSTSNTIDIALNDHSKPTVFQLKHVSILADGKIEIKGAIAPTPSLLRSILQTKPFGSTTWTFVTQLPAATTTFNYTLNGQNTSSQKHQFRLIGYNICDVAYDTSIVHTSILLQRPYGTNCVWNSYWAWTTYGQNVDENILERQKQGSTWNNKNTSPDSTFIILDTTQALCFKVLSVKIGINNKAIDSAWSNEICLKVFDTTLVPNAFAPGGLNPIFKITNLNIAPGEAQMLIFNRWGELVFRGDALTGWDGTDKNGKFVGPGFYPYLINIVRKERRDNCKGTVMVLR